MEEKWKKISDTIIDIYLNLKLKCNEQSSEFHLDVCNKEKDDLMEMDPIKILESIWLSVESILNLKEDKKSESESRTSKVNTSMEPPQDYEEIIQRLEAEVRDHVRVEQQLKLHIENIQFKQEESQRVSRDSFLTKQNEEVETLKATVNSQKIMIERLQNEISKSNTIINGLQSEFELLQKKLASLRSLFLQPHQQIADFRVDLSAVKAGHNDVS